MGKRKKYSLNSFDTSLLGNEEWDYITNKKKKKYCKKKDCPFRGDNQGVTKGISLRINNDTKVWYKWDIVEIERIISEIHTDLNKLEQIITRLSPKNEFPSINTRQIIKQENPWEKSDKGGIKPTPGPIQNTLSKKHTTKDSIETRVKRK